MLVLRRFSKNRCRKLNGDIFVNNCNFLKMFFSKKSLKILYDIGPSRTDVENKILKTVFKNCLRKDVFLHLSR